MILLAPALAAALQVQAAPPLRIMPAAPSGDPAKDAKDDDLLPPSSSAKPPRRAPEPSTQAGADGPSVRLPAWRRRPTGAEILSVYPPAALAEGVGGVIYLRCTVEPDSTLSHCVASDPKDGYGFGAAVLRLVSSLRIRPETVDDRPLVGGKILAPIRFDPPATSIAKPQWTASPTTAEVQSVQPRIGGRLSTVGGRGVMRCTVSGGLLSDCRPAGDLDDPFGRAAVKLAAKFALAPTFVGGKSTEGAIINVPVTFDAPGVKPPPPALENPVRFIHAPTNAERAALFPRAAKDHGVTTVTVSEACVVAPDGSLTKCHATKEDPVGLGGAEAATRLVNAFQLPTWSAAGRPVAGAPVNIDIVWAPPTAAEPRGDGTAKTGPAEPAFAPPPKPAARRR